MGTLIANTLVRDPQTGEVVVLNKGDEVPEQYAEFVGQHLLADDSGDGWEGKSLADLKAELEARNAQRAADSQIEPAGKKKSDLVAALVADDAAAESD